MDSSKLGGRGLAMVNSEMEEEGGRYDQNDTEQMGRNDTEQISMAPAQELERYREDWHGSCARMKTAMCMTCYSALTCYSATTCYSAMTCYSA